ncbi:glycosyltransferase family 39 protein [Nocardioides sp. 1609]|uniref:glycosyltransferase family 39 protein n=1 Tax=Nocardioides sp. 1609 TaxID=2508327 RepID=UPI00106F46FB|nr:glycosyltransferase family 39 protein [Nocardioides sp. 1609]
MLAIPGRLRRVPPLAVLLTATAALYLWGLGSSGWANAYYSAAAQAGAQSWTAFFFGSFDAAGSITVDKPPLAVWPMALSVRLFGLSTWSILVPQVLLGVATVAVVHAGVRRATGSPGAAVLAGTAFALTPVAVLMFRYNNPDSLLVLLLTGSAVATLRAIDRTRDGTAPGHRALPWLVLAGSLVGLAFLTKMLQAFLVLPALAATYAVFAVVPWRRRLLHLLAAAGAAVVSGSWWIVAVDLWPASSRPYIGGSQSNSVLELVLGYNGVGRLTGDQTGAVRGPGGWGTSSLLRLLDPGTGSQVAWLLPAAVVLGIAGLVMTRGTDDRRRPALALWLTWTLVTWLVFSLMNGIFHDYYTVALVPAVTSLVGIGAHVVWEQRTSAAATRVWGVTLAATGAMALVVLWPRRDWQPWLPWLVVAAVSAAVVLAVVARGRGLPLGAVSATVALTAALAAPAAYSVETVLQPHSGAVPHAGPPRAGTPATAATARPGSATVGDLLTVSRSSRELTAVLLDDAEAYTWVAAVTGANSAAGFQLATGRPVMPVGGFNGTDPSPAARDFRQLVRTGRIHYYIAGGGTLVRETDAGEPGPVTRTGSDDALRIDRWVARRFEPRVVDGVTLYDLSRPPARGALTGA